MKLFILSVHCTSRSHCQVCRNKEHGRMWRQSLSQVYELPTAEPGANPFDFECPYGLKWNESVPVNQNSVPVNQNVKVMTKERVRQNIPRKGCGCSRNK